MLDTDIRAHTGTARAIRAPWQYLRGKHVHAASKKATRKGGRRKGKGRVG